MKDNQGQLHHEVRRFYLHRSETEAQKNLTSLRRETLFIDMLENLPDEEAQILLGMKEGKLPYKGITKVCNGLFSGLGSRLGIINV